VRDLLEDTYQLCPSSAVSIVCVLNFNLSNLELQVRRTPCYREWESRGFAIMV